MVGQSIWESMWQYVIHSIYWGAFYHMINEVLWEEEESNLYNWQSSYRKYSVDLGIFFHCFYLACQLPDLLLIDFPKYKAPCADSQQCFPVQSIPMVYSALWIKSSHKRSSVKEGGCRVAVYHLYILPNVLLSLSKQQTNPFAGFASGRRKFGFFSLWDV